MLSRRLRPFASMSAALVAMLALSAGAVRAQAPAYQVLIDGVRVGSATAAANLPVQGVPTMQRTDTTAPPHQAAAGTQTSVVISTNDAALLTVLHGWVAANNSGTKNTVQPKLVEIDQVLPTGGPLRYVLHDAWPSRFDAPGPDGTVMVTFVYQRAEVLH